MLIIILYAVTSDSELFEKCHRQFCGTLKSEIIWMSSNFLYKKSIRTKKWEFLVLVIDTFRLKSASSGGERRRNKVPRLQHAKSNRGDAEETHPWLCFIRQDDNVNREKYFSKPSREICVTPMSILNINFKLDLYHDRYQSPNNSIVRFEYFIFQSG